MLNYGGTAKEKEKKKKKILNFRAISQSCGALVEMWCSCGLIPRKLLKMFFK